MLISPPRFAPGPLQPRTTDTVRMIVPGDISGIHGSVFDAADVGGQARRLRAQSFFLHLRAIR